MRNKLAVERRRLTLRPLVLSVALALSAAAGPALASPTADAVAEGPRQRGGETAYDHRSLAERIPPGHPWYTRYIEATTRQPPDRPAGAVAVTNCNDSGAGSLRAAVLDAVNGDTVDLTDLACSTISLTSGTLITAVDELTILGPGINDLLISGDDESPVFVHLGAGMLEMSDLRVATGRKYSVDDPARGGCLYSQGSISLNDVHAKYCTAHSVNDVAQGGAIYAAQGVTLIGSRVSGSDAITNTGSSAGGGIYTADGGVVAKYSEIDGNTTGGSGGGVLARGGANIKYSTVADNEAGIYGGGLATRGEGDVAIATSTISGNHAASGGGGIDLDGSATDAVSVRNSTIAENTTAGRGGGVYILRDVVFESSTVSGNIERHDETQKYGGGLFVTSGTGVVELKNTIVSGNWKYTTTGTSGLRSDIRGAGEDDPYILTGSGSLLGHLVNATAPSGSRIGEADLGPLQDNGGLTDTMLPNKRSPAINGGGATTLTVDQRGSGFTRTIGAATDIGAVESDTLFADWFEVFHEVSP